MELTFKILVTLFVTGAILVIVGITFDTVAGYFSKWENVVYTGLALVLVSLVASCVLLVVGMWQA